MPDGRSLTIDIYAADKAGDAVENAGKRKKNSEAETKKENLSDRYR